MCEVTFFFPCFIANQLVSCIEKKLLTIIPIANPQLLALFIVQLFCACHGLQHDQFAFCLKRTFGNLEDLYNLHICKVSETKDTQNAVIFLIIWPFKLFQFTLMACNFTRHTFGHLGAAVQHFNIFKETSSGVQISTITSHQLNHGSGFPFVPVLAFQYLKKPTSCELICFLITD